MCASSTSSLNITALKSGYRHIDCARIYGNESEVGAGISKALKEGVVKREEIFVTSKVWNNAHAPQDTLASIEATLKDLQLDYLDLLLIHWPVNFKKIEGQMVPRDADGNVIQEEDESVASVKLCWQAMESAVEKGLVKSIGVSNFSIQEIDDLLAYARIKPAAQQIEIHPYFQQDEMIAYCKSKNITIEAYSPLGNLKNTGEEDVTPLNDPVVAELGKKYNKSAGQIVLRWGLQHSGVVLPKSTNPERIKQNLSITDFTLSDEDMAKMKELGKKNHRVSSAHECFEQKDEIYYKMLSCVVCECVFLLLIVVFIICLFFLFSSSIRPSRRVVPRSFHKPAPHSTHDANVSINIIVYNNFRATVSRIKHRSNHYYSRQSSYNGKHK